MDKLIIDDKNQVRHTFCIQDSALVYKCGDTVSVLIDGGCSDIDGCIDTAGIMYVMCVADKSLVCCTNIRGSWSRYSIDSSGTEGGYIYSVRTVCISGRVNIWYSKENEEKNILLHRIMDGTDVISEACAVATLGRRRNFDICCDNDLNTHIYYTDRDDTLKKLQYLWSQKKYSPPEEVANQISNIAAVCDEKGTVYIAATGKKAQFNVVYFGSDSADELKILGFGVDSTCVPALFFIGDRVYVQWIDNKECCECTGNDRGTSFDRPHSVNRMSGGPNGVIAYKNSSNPLNIGMGRCLCNYAMKMLHEAAILKYAERFATEDVEITQYAKTAGSSMQVNADVMSMLCSMERMLCEMYAILQQMTCGKYDDENKTDMTGDVCNE